MLVINSAEENRFVANLLRDQGYSAAWLGTRRNSGYYGTWKQLDGEEVTFNMLRERESLIPVGRFDRDDSCVMIYGGQWYSVGCSDGGPAATMCKRRIS